MSIFFKYLPQPLHKFEKKEPEPRKEFFWTDPELRGRGSKSKFQIFSYRKLILLVFKKGNESDDDLDGRGNWVKLCTLHRGGN